MPFWYHVPIPIPTLPHPTPELVRLVKWLVEDGADVHVGTRIAVFKDSTGTFAILTNGDGILRTKLFPAGAELPLGTPVAVVDADGDNIPYGGPYSIAEPTAASGEPCR